jgi:hypothetical protein
VRGSWAGLKEDAREKAKKEQRGKEIRERVKIKLRTGAVKRAMDPGAPDLKGKGEEVNGKEVNGREAAIEREKEKEGTAEKVDGMDVTGAWNGAGWDSDLSDLTSTDDSDTEVEVYLFLFISVQR